MPDLNSLPPSRSPSTSRILASTNSGPAASPPSPSSHSPHSLAATAALNAGARSTERRLSSARMHPGLGEAGLERHGRLAERERAPSLGELHQELEQEQEGQVNRLLHMIRQQQAQIQQLQLSQQGPDASAPSISRSRSRSRPPADTSLSRRYSYHSSRENSPLIRPRSRAGTGHEAREGRESADFTLGTPAMTTATMTSTAPTSERDDAAFYAMETQMLTRENAMLRQRIRELERQLTEAPPQAPAAAGGPTVGDGAAGQPASAGQGDG